MRSVHRSGTQSDLGSCGMVLCVRASALGQGRGGCWSQPASLSSSQKGPIALEVEEWLAKEAKQRQKEHGKTAPGRKTLTQKVEQVSRNDRLATAQAAAIVGSRPTGANPRPGNAERSHLLMQSGRKVNKPSSCLTGQVRRGDLARPSLRISVGGPTSPVPSATRKVGWR
jgi:hypothetical protein